jgi:hypothetical protein
MHRVKSLPDYLRERYDHWKQSSFPGTATGSSKLAIEGQHPRRDG